MPQAHTPQRPKIQSPLRRNPTTFRSIIFDILFFISELFSSNFGYEKLNEHKAISVKEYPIFRVFLPIFFVAKMLT